MGTLALIGLGSNLGDRKATLDAAVAALSEEPGTTLRAVSPYHETAPVGGPEGQGAFLNGAASVETDLPPGELLRLLHRIEYQSGRVRSVRWGERTLDLDLLLYGDAVIESTPVFNRVFGGLSVPIRVPHPRMALRRFVLAPLADIAPEAVDPLTGRTVKGLLANLDRRPSYVAIHASQPLASKLYWALVAGLTALGLPEQMETEDPRPRSRLIGALQGDEAGHSTGPARESESRRTDPRARFDQECRDLEAVRLHGDLDRDRWVVSNFWFDANLDRIVLSLDGELSPLLERFLEVRARVLAPTFVVVPAGCRMGLMRLGGRWPTTLGDVPALEIRRDDPPEAIAEEVMATCRATRPG